MKQMGFLKRKWFRERNQSMAYLAFQIQDSYPKQHVAESRKDYQREKLVLLLQIARIWLEFFCCLSTCWLPEKEPYFLKPLQKLQILKENFKKEVREASERY